MIDEYFDTVAQGCSKTDDILIKSMMCLTLDTIDGDINEWRNDENVGFYEKTIIGELIRDDQSESFSSGEYTTTCGKLSASQRPFGR